MADHHEEWKCRKELPPAFYKAALEMLLEYIDWGVQITDEEGYTIYYNKEASRLDGIDRKEALGKHILEMFPSLIEGDSTVVKVLRTGEPVLKQEQEVTNLYGRRNYLFANTLPIVVDGQVVGAIDISKDLTTVKKLMEDVIGLTETVHQYRKQGRDTRNEEARYTFDDIVGFSPAILALKEKALKVSKGTAPIFVYGETGTGKELLVQAIHNVSPRKDGPFIAQNCAALPENLMESILFGTVKGSFTGAENRPGLVELAEGGTLFLDEINSLSFDLQAKLLRFLQDGRIRRVGDSKTRKVDLRIISASNIEPAEALNRKLLRPDLFYRLNVISLRVPTLRERQEDIPVLTRHFIQELSRELGKNVRGVSRDVERIFLNYPWPGNIRELRDAIECAVNLCEGTLIEIHDLPEYMLKKAVDAGEYKEIDFAGEEQDLRTLMQQMEGELIRKALKRAGGNTSKAAKMLGIPRQTLQYKLKNLGMDPD